MSKGTERAWPVHRRPRTRTGVWVNFNAEVGYFGAPRHCYDSHNVFQWEVLMRERLNRICLVVLEPET
jgi:hypothetical protein